MRLNIFKRNKNVVTVESVFIDEVWQEIQKLVESGKVKKWFIVTPADYDYLKSIYNLQMSKLDMANVMAKRYKWMLDKGQELELKIYLTRLANNITREEQEAKLRQALHFMAKGLRIKPGEVMFGWYASNGDSRTLLENYKLKLINEKSYKKVYTDYEVVENIWRKKSKKKR
jgi:hypothetical protein